MPKLIKNIDAIAREKQRDVLYLSFYPKQMQDPEEISRYSYCDDVIRSQVLAWLDEHEISWEECGPSNLGSYITVGYFGDVYIDVPYDESDEKYRVVQEYLENPDGTMKHETVTFYYLPLELAMKNAHHDEPGFWEKFWGD